jgi:hypothetical protein
MAFRWRRDIDGVNVVPAEQCVDAIRYIHVAMTLRE